MAEFEMLGIMFGVRDIIPPLIGGILGALGLYFTLDSVCALFKRHKYLTPIAGFFGGVGAALILGGTGKNFF